MPESLVRHAGRALLGLVAATSLIVAPARLVAQAPGGPPSGPVGRIVGRVVDAQSGAGVANAGVQIVGTTLGAMSGVDGRYAVVNVPAGTVTIQVRRLGYQAKTVTGIMLAAGQSLEQDVSLAGSTVQLQAVSVTAAAERGSVSAALDQQRTATGIVSAVTSEQIQRSPDSDAAQAVQRVSGVTVQDGRYVFVRGLGERYTTTSLNGARLPSPEPERKVVPLDLFPSGLLQTVTTSKTFTPDQPGDFSGAQVDIRTREFPARRQLAYSATMGWNGRAAGAAVPFAPGVGGEAFAVAGTGRNLPAIVRHADDLTETSQVQKNAIINSFRDVWEAGTRAGRPNGATTLSLGGNDAVLGHRVGYLASGTYSYSQEVRDDEVRALARAAGSGQGEDEYNRFEGTTGRSSVLLGGLFNLSTLVGNRTRLALNNTYSRSADNDARVETGTYEDLSIPVSIQRLDYVQRAMWSSQLAGEHDLGRHQLDWAASASGVTRDQPDRSELAYEMVPGGRRLWLNTIPEGAVRTFAALDERAYEGRVNYQLQLGGGARPRHLKVGALARSTDRDADTRSFGIFARALAEDVRALAPAELFGGRFTTGTDATLSVRSLAQGGSYGASDRLAAGYAMVDAALTERVRLIGGARVERSDVRVDAVSTLGDPSVARRAFTDVLPAAALNLQLTESQNVRLSATRTLARPEYRELAGIRTREVLGGVDTRGNPDLVRTRIDNADLRWEWYPEAGEVLSVAVFAKRFHDPIERVFRPTSTNTLVTFVNAAGADNYGVELEGRKSLAFLAAALEPVTAFANLTLMRSEIRLGASEAASTRANRAMAGQAPYVINTGVTWAPRGGAASVTLLYNRVGERIVHAGELPLPDVRELPRDVLDVSLRVPVLRGLSARLDGRNLFDAPYRLVQGAVTRETYRTGRVVQTGLSWQP